MLLSSLPSPNAARKSWAVGPSERRVGSAPLKFHEYSGMALSRCRMSPPSASTKFSFTLRSLVHCQPDIPGIKLQNCVGPPVVASIAYTMLIAPVARTAKRFELPARLNSKFSGDDQTKLPFPALDLYPAAKLYTPPAVLRKPPGTVLWLPLLTLALPPPIAAA